MSAMYLVSSERENKQLHSDTRLSYRRETLLDLRPINSDINKSDIVWYDDTLKESLARDYSAVRKRTRRGTKGNKRRHNTRTRLTIERPSSNQVIKRANSKEKTVGTSLKQPNILLANCQSLASALRM